MSDLILKPEGFGLKVYNRFPPRYREDDALTNYALKRYLDACGEGGFKFSIQEWNGILDFANPDQVTPKVLPILYQQYGLDIFNGIPEQFLRYLLPRLGEAWSLKGSLDAVEFVVTSITGVKTITTVHYDEEGNADAEIYLQMDYTLSDFFPEPFQFSRLIDKFLPFYLGKTLIYSFIFYEDSGIHLEEDQDKDRVIHSSSDIGVIVSSGLCYPGILNNLDKVLNSTFILNESKEFPEPDVFFDKVHHIQEDTGAFSSERCNENHYSVWNLSKLNKDLWTNGSPPVRTDEYQDSIVATTLDTGHLKCVDTDVSETMSTKSILNESGSVASQDTDTIHEDVVDTTQDSGTVCVFSPCFLTNYPAHTLNASVTGIPESFDVVKHSNGTVMSVFYP